MGGEDIRNRTFEFAKNVVRLCDELMQRRGAPPVLAKQLLRSGTSVGANLREAQSAESKRDFVHKLQIALKEARESDYWMRLMIASELATFKSMLPMIDECDSIVATLVSIIQTTRKNQNLNPQRTADTES
jgi:four helix bundle protein